MDFDMKFHYDNNFNCTFIHDFVNFLVSRGVRYNGHYLIMSYDPDPSQDIDFWEKDIIDSTEKLTDIVDIYCRLGIKNFFLSINLDYTCDVNTGFGLSFVPYEGYNCSMIAFHSNTLDFVDEKAFLAFVNLCTEVFEKFNFSFGGLVDEYEHFPLSGEEFINKIPNYVSYYSKSLIEKYGRGRLFDKKAREIKELENGSIMLYVCPIYDGHFGCG